MDTQEEVSINQLELIPHGSSALVKFIFGKLETTLCLKAGLLVIYSADVTNIGKKTKVLGSHWVGPRVAATRIFHQGHKHFFFTEAESEAPLFISGFPISLSPFPAPLSHCPSLLRRISNVAELPCQSGPLAGERKGGKKMNYKKSSALFSFWFCRRIASWNPGIVRSSGSRAQAASTDYPQGRKEKVGGWGGGTIPVPTFQVIYLFFLVTHSQVHFFFLESTSYGFGFVSSLLSPPFIVSVCGLKGSYLCKGITWAGMRLNHKCKVASATCQIV